MHKYLKRGIGLLALMICMSLLFGSLAFAEEMDMPEGRTVSMEVTNRTGKVITAFAVKDISVYPSEDYEEDFKEHNLIPEGDGFLPDQTLVLEQIPVEFPSEEDLSTPSEKLAELKTVLKEYAADLQYLAAFQIQDEDHIYVLHVFLPELAYHTEIFLEDEIAWIEYTTKGSEEVKSTKDAELAVKEMEKKGLDASGEAPQEREIISQVAFPNCDDGSHGYYEITYSDGSVEYVEY